MTDSTNPRVMADNIKELSASSESQAAGIEDLEDDLGTLQTTVGNQGGAIEALQTTVGNQGDAIEALGSYSTTEVDTGMKWIGNTNIFRKIFYVENMPNASSATIVHNIENLGVVIDLYGSIQNVAGTFAARTFNYTNSLNVVATESNIIVTSSADLSSYSAYIVLEYTKAAAPAPASEPET